MRFRFRYGLMLIAVLLSSQSMNAQADSINFYLKSAKQAYKLGNYASSTLDFEKALEFSNSLSPKLTNKNAIKLKALNGLITVSGMDSAMALAENVYKKYKSFIFQNLCDSNEKALKIGLINNFIAVAYHNNYNDQAIRAYKDFIYHSSKCTNFRDVDKVQASANATLAYAMQKNTQRAYDLLPLLSYYVDSLTNFTKADYEKVLANVKSQTSSSKKEIINHYKNAAKAYKNSKKYRYEFNVYETLIKDYATDLNNNELIDIITRSKIAKEKSPYYHSDQYNKMMKELGVLMLERSEVEVENQQLQNYSFIGITLALLMLISLLFIANRRQIDKKNIYEKLYSNEKQLKSLQEKLTHLRHNFIKQNYDVSLLKKTDVSQSVNDLYESLLNDFPQLNYNIRNAYPDLTKKEMQIIYLSLLNISNKESASFLSLTYGSYRVAKNRLLKKMNCKDRDHFETSIKILLS